MGKPDFSYLARYSVDPAKLVWYDLLSIEGVPGLLLAPATEDNIPYYDDLLVRNQRLAVLRAARGGHASVDIVRANRDAERESYSKFIVHDWRKVVEKSGAAVPFNEENCRAYLTALPDDIFDDVRRFAAEPSNFFRGSAIVEGLAGNS